MIFNNRKAAGKLLAERLMKYRRKDAVVLALPRGGVVVGYEVAKVLNLPFDIIVACKIGHPNNPEFAVGAVDEKGMFVYDESEYSLIDKTWLAKELEHQKQNAARRIVAYRGKNKMPEIKEKVAIIVDDGVATGLTMRLAIAKVKEQKPARIIVAVPVAPLSVVNEFKREIYEFIVLTLPEEFAGAVGAHYREFNQVDDDEVIRLLK